MPTHDLLGTSLSELEHACVQATKDYQKQRTSDPSTCLEIFRRAIRRAFDTVGSYICADPDAAELLVRLQTSFIHAQISRRILQLVDREELTQMVWLKFWSRVLHGKTPLSFDRYEKALSFLKHTTFTTLFDWIRQQRKERCESSLNELLESSGDEIIAHVQVDDLFDSYKRKRFNQRCVEIITDMLELRVFVANRMGYKPKEIAQHLAAEGAILNGRTPTARVVSDTLDRIFKRLEHDPEIRTILGED